MASSGRMKPEDGEEMCLRVCTCSRVPKPVFVFFMDASVALHLTPVCETSRMSFECAHTFFFFAPPGYLHRSGVHVLVFAPTWDVHWHMYS